MLLVNSKKQITLESYSERYFNLNIIISYGNILHVYVCVCNLIIFFHRNGVWNRIKCEIIIVWNQIAIARSLSVALPKGA